MSALERTVTRFEVIDISTDVAPGRVLVRHGVRVEVFLQDGGRTMKVFLMPLEPNPNPHNQEIP